jgi:hypothetical protein
MQLIGVLLAAVVGLPCWSLMFILQHGTGHFGGAELLGTLLFLSPSAFLLPLAWRNLERESLSGAAWIFALLPVVCALVFALEFALAIGIGHAIGAKEGPLRDLPPFLTLSGGTILCFWIGYRILKAPFEATTNVPTTCKAEEVEDLGSVDWKQLGTCPNCKAIGRLTAKECKHCPAAFGEFAAWKMHPLRNEKEHRLTTEHSVPREWQATQT